MLIEQKSDCGLLFKFLLNYFPEYKVGINSCYYVFLNKHFLFSAAEILQDYVGESALSFVSI